MKEFIAENIHTILVSIAGGGGFLGWFFERRKKKLENESTEADVESKEIDNGEKIIDMYKKALDDLTERHEKKFTEISALYEKKIESLKEEITIQNRIIKNLRKENADLRKCIKELEK